MTPEEFKKRFKVGDKVIYSGSTYKITAIGKETFLGCYSALSGDELQENQVNIDCDWTKVEPEKLPSEEIREIILAKWENAGNYTTPRLSIFEESIYEWLDKQRVRGKI